MIGTTEFYCASASRATVMLVHEDVAWRISFVKAKTEKPSPTEMQLYLPTGDL